MTKNFKNKLFNSRESITDIIGDIMVFSFLIRRLHQWFLRPEFLELTFSISVISALELKFVCVTSFVLLLGRLRDLPHLKNDFWNGMPRAFIAVIFRQSAGYVLKCLLEKLFHPSRCLLLIKICFPNQFFWIKKMLGNEKTSGNWELSK